MISPSHLGATYHYTLQDASNAQMGISMELCTSCSDQALPKQAGALIRMRNILNAGPFPQQS
ncbi:hypothetical protein CEV32_1280 [Brucella rhizosphaerae]|uniref:Uncharacterized protein n=1 Tax=Brucella rhizosphaerae TaxID=571254 RepID=A0A256FAA4_9HYPH|nr:hypothetical protein CEV32_1280 [Brucella rhizosphaerae]